MSHPHQQKPADSTSLTRGSASYFSEDTIVAPASVFGGALGVIRVSGPAAFSSLSRLAPGAKISAKTFRMLVRAHLFDGAGRGIDDALIACFKAPESYTGEDCVEYHLHGNILIASTLMENLEALGVRRALPGEFSFRAVRNGKLTLSQASGVADLVAAANPTAVQLALEKLSQQQNRWIATIGESLRGLALQAEAAIDFSDQDLGETPLPRLSNEAAEIQATLEKLAATFDRGKRIQQGVRVAFLGLPNAGKSSLFNALLGEDRSIVSDIPGTTRDVVGEHLTLRSRDTSATFRLEDTAGLRDSMDQIETLGIQRSLRSAREADLILFVIDAMDAASWLAGSPNALDSTEAQLRSLGAPAEKTIAVLNKADLISGETAKKLKDELSQRFGVKTCTPCSSLDGSGIDELVQVMVGFCEKWYQRDPGEFLLTRAEHALAVNQAVEHTARAARAPELDLFASDLRQALHALAPLIGETVPDDILNAIFSRFCIGK